ncbi:hypothetical protein HFO38_30550 [Rhizobium leguminosarum]|uniref:hypothetical protein n=1 Tax=Rhizobium leguminosarum TaxID=384 RepID=UPI001C981405|nr:hypothetical protein [Rhizobium leguminosarum]MBY5706990.1 hypothetical protein [Rhizobium leguminosarum]
MEKRHAELREVALIGSQRRKPPRGGRRGDGDILETEIMRSRPAEDSAFVTGGLDDIERQGPPGIEMPGAASHRRKRSALVVSPISFGAGVNAHRCFKRESGACAYLSILMCGSPRASSARDATKGGRGRSNFR